MTIVWLILIGFIEAIVYLVRYRTATSRNAWISAASSMAICITRVWFVFIGATAVIAETNLVTATLAYGISATITTGVLHEWLERRKEREDEAVSTVE